VKISNISIILVEPETSGNVGAIARSMKNFDFKNLIIINPACNPLDDDAIRRSKFAKDVLQRANVIRSSSTLLSLKKFDFDYIIATSGKLGSDYNLSRTPMDIEKYTNNLTCLNNKIKVAIMFGREGIGLKNEELNIADLLITIPSSSRYPILNLSHAVNIICYEVYKVLGRNKITTKISMANKIDKDILYDEINKKLNIIKFSTIYKKQTQKRLWKKIIGKLFLSKREFQAMMGFFKKIK
jgi:TrmH family RNA methyltransferase